MATIQSLEAEYQSLLAQRDVLAAQYQSGNTSVLPEIQAINAQIRAVLIELDALKAAAPPVSSGQELANAQLARDDGASIQNPPTPPGTTTPTTAPGNDTVSPPGTFTVGTDGRFRSSTETQANPAPTSLPGPAGYGSGAQVSGVPTGNNNADASPTNTAGVGAPGEDSSSSAPASSGTQGTGTGSNDVVTLANKTARAIVPQPNALDGLANYTYSASIYLMSPEDYQRLMTTGKKYLAGYQLLMQSAGAPQQSGFTADPNIQDDGGEVNGGVSLTQGRNQFFPLDYYLDDIQLTSLIQGKGTGGAHNVTEMKFKIVEPNGITLLDNLYNATHQYITMGGGASKSVGASNYAAQNYLLVLRFYGYDQNGNAVITPNTADPAGRSDNRAIIEKFIPFQFTGIKFRIANRLTEYECTAVCPQNVIGTGQGRGVIPYNIEITGTTLQNLFNGNINYTKPGVTASPDKAAAAPNPTLNSGLVQALNKFQAEQVTSNTYDVADRYKIIISHPEIANASIVPPGQINRLASPMVDATTAAQAKDGTKQSMSNNAKTVSATAGMSIVQFIDLAVRSSDYVYKQQTKIIDKDGKIVPQGSGAQAFAWYRIGVEAKPIRKDPKRNDDAYEITYEIAPYGINDIKSEYFPKGKFRGAQKKYNYWFTGENVSILNFEQDFNYLYYITVNSRQSPQTSKNTSDYREIEKRLFAPNSPQTNQGEKGNRNEPSANAADYLYSPSDQGRVKLTIIGDPAWIQQGEVWSGVRSTKKIEDESYDAYFDAFLPDGTINFDAREALFEINFNKPADYDLQSGVMKVSGTNVKSQSYIYKATIVTSNFRQGRFTQELEGVLLIFPDPVAQVKQDATTTTTTTTTTENQSPAETARLERLASAANGLPTIPTTSVTGTRPTSSLAKGTDQILRPPTVIAEPTLSQLQSSPAYITARRGGATPAAALEIARSAFASGTNNYAGVALPGINVTTNNGIVKDQ